MRAKEEHAIILDFLPHGYPFDTRPMHQKTSIAQAIGKEHFTLLELVPKKGEFLQPHEVVYIGEGKRDKIYYILGRLQDNKLTETARDHLNEFIGKHVEENEKKFIEFFNKAEAINTRLHQFELLPGFGKKHTDAILEQRNKKIFISWVALQKFLKHMTP